MGSVQQHEQRSGERVAAILDAACRVIAREGADGLRMSAVAAEAGVSTALIHYYFATRADLLARAFEHADEQADQIIDDLTEGLDTALERLDRVLVSYAAGEVFRTDWILWIEMWRGAIFNPGLRPVVQESNAQWVEQITQMIRDGREDGSIPPGADAVAVARRLTALTDGLGLQVLTEIIDQAQSTELVAGAIRLELGLA